MSTNIVPITLREAPWQGLADDIVIGKDILELLSSSMYVDPMTIYREYVQNSADAIDEAKRIGLLPERSRGRVEITLDDSSRAIRIRDNGTGVDEDAFYERLTAFGASLKRGKSARGF